MDEYTHVPVTVEGKRAVVIGGTSGIGRAIALGFAADGADVIASSRTPERVEDTAGRIRDHGATTGAVTVDVSDRESIEALLDSAIDTFGGVDVLVTSASAIARKSTLDVTEEEWTDVIDVQLDGVYRATQVFGRAMEEGSMIHISSLAPQIAASNLAAYTAAKGGVDAFTRVAAKELAPDIRVNAIAPGYVETGQTREVLEDETVRRMIEERSQLGRIADPGEIAGAAIYLASDAASYTTGEVLTVDAGFGKNVF